LSWRTSIPESGRYSAGDAKRIVLKLSDELDECCGIGIVILDHADVEHAVGKSENVLIAAVTGKTVIVAAKEAVSFVMANKKPAFINILTLIVLPGSSEMSAAASANTIMFPLTAYQENYGDWLCGVTFDGNTDDFFILLVCAESA